MGFRPIEGQSRWLKVIGPGLIPAVFLLVCGWLISNQTRLAARIDAMTRAPDLDGDKAIARGSDAIRKGQWELGQLYLVNAVTNAPRKLAHLTAYADAVLERKEAPLDALDRLASVLKLAAYQVDSGDVVAVLALIERAEQARDRSAATDDKGSPTPGPGPDLPAQWEKLGRVGADPNLWKDLPRLAVQIKALEDFLATLEDQDESTSGLGAKVAADLTRLSQVAQAAKQCGYIDACLDRLTTKDADLATQRSVAIVQAAENALPSFWGLDLAALPPELQARFDGYPKRIEALVKEIGKARSASILKQIHDALAGDAKKLPDQPWQKKCEAIEKQLKDAQSLVAQLTSTDALLDAQKEIEKRSGDLRRCRNEQYYEYQAWVIKKSEETFKYYMSYRIDVSESESRKIFKDYGIAEVDQSLLSPEVSRIFNDVLGKLMSEMGAKALVATEKDMGTTTKKKLEDF